MPHYLAVMFDQLFSRRGFSLDRLKTLVEIHYSGSIAKAAGGDPVRASLQSRQLRELAEYFGAELAVRKGSKLQLTPEGVQLAQMARDFLSQISEFEAASRNGQTRYSIAAGDSLIQWLVVPRIATLVDALPQVRLGTFSMQTSEIIRQVGESRIDVGLVRRTADMPGLRTAQLGRLTYRIVVPLALLAGRPKPNASEVFTRLPMAMQITAGEFTTTLTQIAQTSHRNFQPALECQSLPQVLSAVQSRRFAAVLPDLATDDLPSQTFLVLKATELRPLERDVCLVWNPRSMKIRTQAQKLIDACRESLRF